MTPAEMALAFAFLGGVLVSTGIAALAGFLRDRFRHFEERSALAAEDRREALALLHDLREETAHATLAAAQARDAIRSERARAESARILRASTDRRARILRLRQARARGERHPTWPHSHLGPRR